jgi:hypothetical protein
MIQKTIICNNIRKNSAMFDSFFFSHEILYLDSILHYLIYTLIKEFYR